MLIVGRKVIPWLLWQVAGTGSRELFTLAVVSAAIGIAFGAAKLFSVSFALGAFFAGMVMRESEFSHRAAEESLPLRDAFSVLFFVSVGMLFQPDILLDKPLQVLGVVAIIMLGKTLAALAIVLAFRYPLNTALTVAASLAQIGEFSFILAGLGQALGLMSVEAMNLVLAGALFSIALNPLMFSAIDPLRPLGAQQLRLCPRTGAARRPLRRTADDDRAQIPRRARSSWSAMAASGNGSPRPWQTGKFPSSSPSRIANWSSACANAGIPSVSGDAADPSVLIQAHIADADTLVVTLPDPINVRQMVETARTLNPDIEVLLRTHSEAESELLRKDKLGTVFFGEEELAKGMTKHLLSRYAQQGSTP